MELVVEPSHVPSEPYAVDALLVTNDRVVEQGAMDDGTGVDAFRLRTEEVGVNIGRPGLGTSLAQGDFRAATDIDDNQREGGEGTMEVYLNVINSVATDGSNEAYGQLLKRMKM
jgi:hypothetical protein